MNAMEYRYIRCENIYSDTKHLLIKLFVYVYVCVCMCIHTFIHIYIICIYVQADIYDYNVQW